MVSISSANICLVELHVYDMYELFASSVFIYAFIFQNWNNIELNISVCFSI